MPWFIKRDRPDLVEAFNIPLDEYIRRCEVQIASWERMRKDLENPETKIPVRRSHEYGSGIMGGCRKPVHPASSTETSPIMV